MSTERLVRLAAGIVRAWVWLYTLGLPASLALARRELIESDVWEQTHDPDARGIVALGLLSRWLRGVPGDLSWRVSTAKTVPAVVGAGFVSPGRYEMASDSVRPAFLSIVTGLGWAVVLVIILAPTPHSLAYAGALLLVVSLAGWVIEARETASDDDEAEPGPSVWPVVLAIGVAGVGAGLVFDGARLGLVLALPWALLASRAWLGVLRRPATIREPGIDLIVSSRELDQRAASGYAIAVERVPSRTVSRRSVLRASAFLGLGATVLAALGSMVDYLWARDVEAFGGVVDAGPAEHFPPGTKTKVSEGRFWLVNLTEEQGGPGYLALWQKCPHLGCVVPWEENFTYTNSVTGESKKGWFRCPCHQSTYDDAGVRVFGPAPRSMDRMEVTVNTTNGHIEVNTGRIAKGTPANARFVVPPEPPPPA